MSITVALIFIVLGILIKYGKQYWLIAGYNTMPKEKQEQLDIKGIANVFRNAMFGMAIIMILGYVIAMVFERPDIEKYAVFAALIIGIPYLLISSNSRKFKKNQNE